MDIVARTELRKGKVELARALIAKGVDAKPFERLDALAAKVAVVGGGSGATPERFGNVTLTPPMPGLSVAMSLKAPAIWNPNDKGENIILADANLTVSSNGGAGGVRGAQSKTSGKWYFEIKIVTVGGYSTVGFGVSGPSTSTSSLMSGAGAAGVYRDRDDIFKYPGPVVLNSDEGWAVNDVFGIAVDIDAKTLQYYRNGAVQDGLVTEIGVNEFFPWVSIWDVGKITACFAAASFTHSPPTGYLAWDS